MFWATYWGELELIKLFLRLSQYRVDLTVRKYTGETVFDVARTSKHFANARKPRHIAKLPLPTRPPLIYEKIIQMLEEYRAQYPCAGGASNGPVSPGTCSTMATQFGAEASGCDRVFESTASASRSASRPTTAAQSFSGPDDVANCG